MRVERRNPVAVWVQLQLILHAVTKIYVVDGGQVRTLEDFWKALMNAFDGPGRQYFGRNFDALADCLSAGGPGAPEDDEYTVEWRDHTLSREYLGYPETARRLELRLASCQPMNRPAMEARLAAVRAEQGPTIFDQLVEIFERNAPGKLRLC